MIEACYDRGAPLFSTTTTTTTTTTTAAAAARAVAVRAKRGHLLYGAVNRNFNAFSELVRLLKMRVGLGKAMRT